MFNLPPTAELLIGQLSIAFTRPTFNRFILLMIAAILTPGRRTITNMLWTVRWLAEGHVSSYHRVLSRAPWSLWMLGRILAGRIVQWVDADQPRWTITPPCTRATRCTGKPSIATRCVRRTASWPGCSGASGRS